jgi:hypothetical protein
MIIEKNGIRLSALIPCGTIIGLLLSHSMVFAQATKPAPDAAAIYLQAAKLATDNANKNIMCPASSNLDYSGPPFPPEWWRLEKESFAANAPALALTHQAKSIEHAEWPHVAPGSPNLNLKYLNSCRALTNELSDAVLYQHLTGHDAAAIETLRDELQLANSLAADQRYLITLLTSIGIRDSAMDRLNVTMSEVKLTSDAQDHEALQRLVAVQLMQKLADQPDAETQVRPTIKAEQLDVEENKKIDIEKIILIAKRVDAECGMAAIGIACHLYKQDTGHWPVTIDDLHTLLPTVPIDPFGDGKQTLGYALIKAGLPTGEDRPLVYSRQNSDAGLFYRTDRPLYSYYNHQQRELAKPGGQFRDITAWTATGKQEASQPLSP